MSPQDHVVIVYQFGKVASTALVKSLNACAGIEAHQSHFLGDDALKRIVVNATSPNLSPYFRKHMVGQLLSNLELTQKLKQLQTGKDPRKLTVVSLAREPLQWFRSSVQQDIAGYQDNLLRLSGGGDGAEGVRDGITAMVSGVLDVLNAGGGADHVGQRIVEEGGRVFLDDAGVTDEFLRTMVLLAMRPLTWFEDHFRKCFDFSLEAIPQEDGFWLRRGHPTSFVVLRYEDIGHAFQPAMNAAGVPFGGNVVQANQSDGKSFAAEVRAGFEGEPGDRLGQLLRASEYGQTFGYDANAAPVGEVSVA